MPKERFEGLIGGLYRRNEPYLLVSTAIFIVSLFIGYAFAGFLDQILGAMFGNLKRQVSEGELQLTTLSLFLNNIKIALFIYAGGLIFGVGTLFFLVLQGAFIGYAATQFSLGDFVIYTAPHGVFEIVAIILAGSAGFKLAYIIFDILKGSLKIQSDFSIKNQLSYLFESNMDDFKDTLVLMGIAAVLLLVAAFIEANLTLPWAQFMQGIM